VLLTVWLTLDRPFVRPYRALSRVSQRTVDGVVCAGELRQTRLLCGLSADQEPINGVADSKIVFPASAARYQAGNQHPVLDEDSWRPSWARDPDEPAESSSLGGTAGFG